MSSSGEEREFLKAILENPADDTVRLVFADWLEEQGQGERAEFIRVQCRIAVLQRTCGCGGCVKLRGGGQHNNGPCAVDKARDELPDGRSRQAFLHKRERELLDGASGELPHRVEWFGGDPWPSHTYHGRFAPVYTRGFVSSITLTLADFEAHVADVFARHPVTACRLSNMTPAHAYHQHFYWEENGDPGYGITPELFDALTDFIWESRRDLSRAFDAAGNRQRGYPTPEAAHAALSAAAVTVGRRRAGLGALPVTEKVMT